MPRMPRTLSRLLPHLVLPLAASVGCSNVVGVRTADSRKIQTFAAIGDKPLPALTGTPGETVVAGVDEPERIPNPRGQITGRVVDADGEPMPNVQVRVAIDGASTGRTGRVTTDDAGRFTLNGLRSGGDYTLIAETEDEQGTYLEGRVVAEAPEKQVRITLKPLDEEEPSSRARVGRVSERSAIVESDEEDASPRVNFEDLPPAAEAESIDEPEPRDEVSSPDVSETSSRDDDGAGGWHGRTPSRRNLAAAIESPAPATRTGELTPIETPTRMVPVEPVDDGPNPLPPALERPAAAPAEETFTALPEQPVSRPTDGFAPAPVVPATPAATEPAPEPVQAPASTPDDAEFESAPVEAKPEPAPSEPAPPPSTAPEPVASDLAPTSTTPEPLQTPSEPALPVEAATPAPAVESPEPAAEPPTAPPANEPPAATPETATAPPPLDDSEPTVPDLLPEESPAPEAAVARPKWGDLAKTSQTDPAPAVAAASQPTVETSKPQPARKWRFFGSKTAELPKRVDNPLAASCEYIPKDRRLVDFQMVDLAGKPVAFHGMGADLVLLDFWGSWCGPCVNSIPKLIELQKLYPEKSFKIVGIAYEQDDRLEDRVQKARQASAQLGIPYTVLLGEADGKPCPLKEALHVQVYPTMVLVDREGNIVWRDQGVGPNTFARLERILATRAVQEIARR